MLEPFLAAQRSQSLRRLSLWSEALYAGRRLLRPDDIVGVVARAARYAHLDVDPLLLGANLIGERIERSMNPSAATISAET